MSGIAGGAVGRPKVLVMQALAMEEKLFVPLRRIADVSMRPPDQRDMERALPGYDAFLIELGLHLHGDLVRACPRLAVVATSTTGTDHIAVDALAERGILLISLKDDIELLRNISATAEMAWALLLAVVRKLPAAFESVKGGDWDRTRFQGRQLRGKTLGIVGYGRLGRIIKDFGIGFHMRVLATDVLDFDPKGEGVEKVDLETLLGESDVVTLHIHLTKETYHFMGAERIRMMKRGAVLINTSRGAVVDEAVLLNALAEGRLAGAGVDVLENEIGGNIGEHPMVRYARGHDNLVISPHVGGAAQEAVAMCMAHTIAKLTHAVEALGSCREPDPRADKKPPQPPRHG
jgi:D-3-phosphoglycerate dehydrogenase / 2-oxoglutarate reductase